MRKKEVREMWDNLFEVKDEFSEDTQNEVTDEVVEELLDLVYAPNPTGTTPCMYCNKPFAFSYFPKVDGKRIRVCYPCLTKGT